MPRVVGAGPGHGRHLEVIKEVKLPSPSVWGAVCPFQECLLPWWLCCCRARDRGTGAICALKKVKLDKEREGFPLTSVREINILLSLDHPNIVNVSEVRGVAGSQKS